MSVSKSTLGSPDNVNSLESRLERELSGLQAAKSQYDAELSELAEAALTSEGEVIRLRIQETRLRAEMESLRTSVTEKDEKIASVEAALQNLSRASRGADEDLQRFRESSRALEGEVARLREAQLLSQRERQQQMETTRTLEVEHLQLIVALNEEIEGKSKSLESLIDEVANLERDLQRSRGRFEIDKGDLERRLSQAQGLVADKAAEIARLSKQASKLETQVTGLQTERSEQSTHLRLAKEEIETLKAALSEREAALEARETTILEQKATISAQSAKIEEQAATFSAKCLEINELVKTHAQALTMKDDSILALEKAHEIQLGHRDAALAKAQDAAANLMSELQDAMHAQESAGQRELASKLSTKDAELQAFRESAQRDLADAQTSARMALQRSRDEIEAMRTNHKVELAGARVEVESMRKTLDARTAKAESEKREAVRMMSEITYRERQLRTHANTMRDEKATILRLAKQLVSEVNAARSMNPLNDYLRLTEFELQKIEVQLRAAAHMSPEAISLENSQRQLLDQREFLRAALASSREILDRQAASLAKIIECESLKPVAAYPRSVEASP